jgi:DNA-binding transcriptional ArsR family regulator
MNTTYPIAAVGELIGDPARAAILIALLDGKARTAGELTLTAGVSAQSASAHLSKLVDGGLLTAVHRTVLLQPFGRTHRRRAFRCPPKMRVIRPSGERDYELGRAGRAWFANLGIDVDSLRRSRRIFARQCRDWTERRPHIAGAFGAALCSRLLALGWIACRRDSRALRITPRGARELHSRLGLTA